MVKKLLKAVFSLSFCFYLSTRLFFSVISKLPPPNTTSSGHGGKKKQEEKNKLSRSCIFPFFVAIFSKHIQSLFSGGQKYHISPV